MHTDEWALPLFSSGPGAAGQLAGDPPSAGLLHYSASEQTKFCFIASDPSDTDPALTMHQTSGRTQRKKQNKIVYALSKHKASRKATQTAMSPPPSFGQSQRWD